MANPNSGGNANYRATAVYHVHVNVGYAAPNITSRVGETLISKLSGGPTPSDVTISAKIWDGTTEATVLPINYGLTSKLRILVYGSSSVGQGVFVRIKKIL